jgi:hypothetical protein
MITKKSNRQFVTDEINNLNNDFRLLWVLRNFHNLYEPLSQILIKIKAMKNLLKFYPEKSCLNCGHKLN